MAKKQKKPSLFRRRRADRLVETISDAELFVVLYWPDPTHHVPVVKGPYFDNDHALKVRDNLRSIQKREEKMAQAMPLARYPHGQSSHDRGELTRFSH